jgi:hypothetical protein
VKETLMPQMNKVIEQISQLDTKSNREMSPLHKRRAEILKKIEDLKVQGESGKKQKKKAAEKSE